MDADELESLKDWLTGESKAVRKWAEQDLARRKLDGAISAAARHLMALAFGPCHRVRRKRAGRRLAFSHLFLIVTGPARRLAAGWGDRGPVA